MTRFVIDAGAALRLAATGAVVPHELLAPTLLRSQVLSTMHEAVYRGELSAAEARARVAAVGRMRIRLLGDAVLRGQAWKVADELGLASTYDAEYLALTRLQGEFFVTLDEDLARTAARLVPVAPFESLLDPAA